MTRGQIRARARVFMNQIDPNNSNFTDDQLNGFLYDWQNAIGALLKWPKNETTIVGGTVVGQRQYTITLEDIMQITDIYVDNKPMNLVTEQYIKALDPNWRVAQNNTPTHAWMIDNNKIALYMEPDTAGQEILIRYINTVADFASDDSSPDLPEAFHHLGAIYCAAMAELTRENLEKHKTLLALHSSLADGIRNQSVNQMKTDGWEWAEERPINIITNLP